MIKLISSDMDGTLLDSYRQITPINVEAIKRAQENGINFIINTGREYPNARGLVEAAGLKCDLICSNGACAFDKDGNLLFEHILDKETVRTIFDAFNKYGMEPALFTTEGRISLLPLEEREIYTRDVFIPAIQVNHPDMKYTLDDYRELVDDVIFVDGQEALLNSDHRILKITSNSPDHESLKKLRVELEKIPGLAVVSTVPTDIEITSINAQKGSSLLDYARLNAKMNGFDNAEFFVGKAEEVLPREYEKNGVYADTIVVDPPRKGCDSKLLETMVKMTPKRIVYVSCDPATLARDLKVLSEQGYEVEKVCAVDQFSHSSHVETVVRLKRK